MNTLKHWYYYITSPMYRRWVRTNEIEEMNNRMFNLIKETTTCNLCPHIRIGSGGDISYFCDCE